MLATFSRRVIRTFVFTVAVTSALGISTFSASSQMRLPPGSYRYTCNACRFDGRYLSCRCATSDGRWFRSSVDWGSCGGRVDNVESNLVCRRY
jgi:hypothetical protein